MFPDHVDTTSSLSTTVSIMSILFSPIFWLYLHQLPYWEMCTDHVSNASTLSKRVYIMSIYFSWFFLIFLLYLHELPYREMRTDHVNNTLTLLTVVYVMLLHFFLIFSWCSGHIYINYHIRNAHRPCKQFPNLVNTCLHHASSFSPDFAWFSDYIWVDYDIWKCAQTM